MSAKQNLQWSADQLVTVREAVRLSNAQGGLFVMAATAPGRQWLITGGSSPVFNSKVWRLKVQTPRCPYVGVRFRAEPTGAGSFRYKLAENGVSTPALPIVTPDDYAHVHLVQNPMAGDPQVIPLVFDLTIEAQTSDLAIRDVQIFGLFTADLPGRVTQLGVNAEVLTTS